MASSGFGNLDKVLDQMTRFVEGFNDGVLNSLYDEAESVAELARDTYTPVDTGALRGTFRITADLSNPELANVNIEVGGPGSAAPYAIHVHERLDLQHNPPTQAKFLERAAHEKADGMTLRIGEGAVNAARSRAGL